MGSLNKGSPKAQELPEKEAKMYSGAQCFISDGLLNTQVVPVSFGITDGTL